MSLPVFILCGQSNMSGRADAQHLPKDLSAPFPSVQMSWSNDINFDQGSNFSFGASDRLGDVSDGWQQLQPQTFPPSNFVHFGPEITLGRELHKHLQEQLYFVKMGLGSTTLARNWNPANSSWDESNWRNSGYYPKFRQFVMESLNSLKRSFPDCQVHISGVFWMQGESDAGSSKTANVYYENLRNFVTTLREDLSEFNNERIPIVMGKINWKSPKQHIVNLAFDKIAKEMEKIATVDTSTLSVREDGHFDWKGQMYLGERMAAEYLKLLT
eukprot:TRINITY_DN2404_c0_g1_i2.p1 TRINITY_DN2404_c0_g1~~TRINITY_DN2404_c0_g1_i2.p1  ORF type:complete len:271 (-),score=40.12 TRINITY_DN2404_c0_g1_i2:345-1157(-)